MTPELKIKYEKLTAALAGFDKLAVAFSGGVDSALLLKTARDALGNGAVAFTARSIVFPESEREEAAEFCAKRGIKQIIVDVDVLAIDGFGNNPPDRCYHCKKRIIESINKAAAGEGITRVAEGSNADDTGDYRPGSKAVKEYKLLSPLLDAGLYKDEIRELSRELCLPTWDKPAFACLASRFPYGEIIDEKNLLMVERAEYFLSSEGFKQSRVRYHGGLARIECDEGGFALLKNESVRKKIYAALKEIGFSYVAADLLGYRKGSMNETLPPADKGREG